MLRVASTHETWTITSKTRKNLEAAEMWFYRRIPRIPWTAHQTNVSVLQRMGQERKLLCCIEQRQLKCLGHVIRKGELEDLKIHNYPFRQLFFKTFSQNFVFWLKQTLTKN